MKQIIDKPKGLKNGINAVLSDDAIKKVMAELGRRGGSKTSDAKTKATKKSLKKARAARWPKKEKQS